jgi:hypothetical protein
MIHLGLSSMAGDAPGRSSHRYAVRSTANRDHVTFTSVFLGKFLEISDLQFNRGPVFDRLHRLQAFDPSEESLHLFCDSAARFNSATQNSTSSISSAFDEWFMTHSAARTFTEAGVPWSSMTLSSVVAAAVAPRWRRATAWEYAARRASR